MGAPPSRSVFSTSTAFCPMLASACAAAKPAETASRAQDFSRLARRWRDDLALDRLEAWTAGDPETRVVKLVLLAGLDLLEVGLELGLLRPPVDADLLHQFLDRARVPVRLHDLVGMRAACQRGELAVGHDGELVALARGLADPLVLVERGDA